MRFRRRTERSKAQKMRQWIWPESGWWRAFMYIWRRVWRLADSPHAIALGFAAGAFASFTPLWTMHFFLAALIAWVLGGNILASAFGTVVGNPVTFPFIVPAIYETGTSILGSSGKLEAFDFWSAVLSGEFGALWPTWKPMALGGIILGMLMAVICYFLVRATVSAYQARRRARFGDNGGDGLAAAAKPAAQPDRSEP